MKLESEKAELEAERADIDRILGSRARLKKLVKQELAADAERYGDARRSPLATAEAATAFTEEDLLTTEPVTVVLSSKGWVRAAKGHDVDPRELSYRTGDEFLAGVRGRSNELLVFFDSTGRTYSLPAHTLPSARGQGEPLTGRLSPPEGSRFVGLVLGGEQRRVLLASNAGYGFVARLADLVANKRAGKAVLSVPKGACALAPAPVAADADAVVVAATDQGRLLAFPLSELPELARGKGVKLVNVPAAAFKSGAETMVAAVVMGPRDELHVRAGQRFLKLRLADVEHYRGGRAQRGAKLPRGFQKVDGLEVVAS
jgi:topoisomerase-4 subunit A